MILDTGHSPTHTDLAERFLLPTATRHGLTVHRRKFEWHAQGDWNAPGTLEQQLGDGARMLLSQPCTGELRMWTGVDIVFLAEWPDYCRKFMDETGWLIAWAWDGTDPCMDFMCYRDTLEARQHMLNCCWQTFVEAQRQTPASATQLTFVNNQGVNSALLKNVSFRWGCFPDDVVCNWPAISKTRSLWKGEQFTLPASCRAFHANWTVGVANKTAMLEQVMRGRVDA